MSLAAACAVRADDARIDVQADRVLHRVSPHLTGACIEDVNHEIYGGIYSQMIFGESFQEPAPTPPIGGFETYSGRWQVDNEILQLRAQDGPKLISNHSAFQNGAVSVELLFKEHAGENAGLILRVRNPRIGADRFIGYEVALEPGRQRLVLARHRNNFEPIEAVSCPVPFDRWITLAVHMKGPILEIFVDNRLLLKHDDGGKVLQAGSVGLRGWHCQAGFRNFEITQGEKTERLTFRQSAAVTEVSGMWRAVQRGNVRAGYGLERRNVFVGQQSQRLSFESGSGACGLENAGLNRQGMHFVAGKPYDGAVWIRAEKPAILSVGLESGDGSRRYAETELAVQAGDWHRQGFRLTPDAEDKTGRFVLSLKDRGSIVVGYAFLQPGPWGRFKDLPVRRDVVEGLIDQGITVLRYGGSMVNNREYKWQNMIGPREHRPPYAGTWYPWSSNGWGIIDFMNLCEAAGFAYVPAFCMDQSPEEMAGFIEYAKGPADSEWGRKRVADGHPQPYKVRYIELGNEERIDEAYAAKFEAIARAIWAKDRDIVLIAGDFAYGKPIENPMSFTGAASRITSLAGHRKLLALARAHDREVWFDVHIGTEGPGPSNDLRSLSSYVDALDKVAGGARHKVVVFEYNSQNHAQRRALGNALATNVIERDGRIPIATSANCLQPDGQNDNGWDQGLLFLNSWKVWPQPPGYATRMRARNYLPELVSCIVRAGAGKIDAVAKRSENGRALVLEVVNYGPESVATLIQLSGFAPERDSAEVTTLAGELDVVNTADRQNIAPEEGRYRLNIADGKFRYTFAPYSFTVLRLE